MNEHIDIGKVGSIPTKEREVPQVWEGFFLDISLCEMAVRNGRPV
jgi:hypothetical protein